MQQSLHNIKIVGEAASTDIAAATRYLGEFIKLIVSGDCQQVITGPEQAFNADEAALFCVIFCDQFQNCFVPEAATYLKKNNLDFNAVSVLDNTLGYPCVLKRFEVHIFTS